MIAANAAYAADEILLLEVTLNGRATQLVAEFTLRDGGDSSATGGKGGPGSQATLYVSRAELTELGIKLPSNGDDPVPLSRFANSVQFDQNAQKISITVPTEYLTTTELSSEVFSASNLPLADTGFGAVINYDLLATQSNDQRVLSGLLDARVYGNGGVLGTSALGYSGDTDARSVRLDSGYTYSDPASLRRYRLGDFVSNGLSWTRPVRLGGAQLSTDFNLRPDLVLFPSPSIRGEAVVPSNVDLFVNGVRQFSQSVAPGPFEIRQAPIASGAGSVAVAVTDALGRQTFQNVPFYTSGRLLKPGLASYSIESGWVRKNYGVASADYGEAALSSSLRYGLTQALTLEAHAEGMRGLKLAGGGAVFNVNNWGIASAALAASDADTDLQRGRGMQYALGVERNANNLSFALSHTAATGGYRDIGAIEGSPVLRSQSTASAGVSMERYGSVNMSYTAIKGASDPLFANAGSGFAGNTGGTTTYSTATDLRVLSVSYFKSLSQRATFFVSGFKQLGSSNTSVTLGLIMPLSDRDVIGINNTSGGGTHATSVQASRATVSPGDFGWQLQDSEGSFVQRSAELDYKSTYGRATVAMSESSGQTGERAGLRGAIALADSSVFFTNWIDDSFAVVNTGGMKGIGVFAENRFAGRTDSGGRLLVPDLRSYDVNRLGIDVLDLPVDAEVDMAERMVKPRDRSGVVVGFATKQSSSAMVTLVDGAGGVLPAGALVTVVETGLKAPVGYDGVSFLSQLGAVNTLQVTLPSGAACNASFSLTARSNTIPDIGPLTCR